MSQTVKRLKYDVAIIGGGPAGMMAAGRAAELGASVILIEKNASLGKKLLITGGGRCNVTNDTLDVRALSAKLKNKGKFLFSAFAQHAVRESLDFFHSHGMETKVENEGRIFPVSNTARSVYDVLVNYMKNGKVEIALGITARSFHIRLSKIVGLNIAGLGTQSIVADSYILATGGTSHPETGSTGAAFPWLALAGHTIVPPDVAMVPIKIAEKWVRDLSGVSNQNAKLSLYENDKRTASSIGRMVFAHFGLSGPLVINFSGDVREAMQYAESDDKIELSLDIMPDYDPAKLDQKIQEIFKTNQNKKLKNALRDLVTPAMVSTIITLTKLDPEKEINLVTRAERLVLGKLLKDMRMTPTGFLGKEKAIVASGGVKLEEIDFRTMQSRLISNLYLIGDVLDIERPSGGYSLQLCWTTGWVAGTHAVEKKF
ncbi:MAG: aminoacetone oxidase family FAD-binding enzyme [bacterium]|nr:aminoacetone oxidase family FAD-binding enzyme [bacterium]